MEIQTISYTMEIPKESKEVVDLIDAILENVMAKKGITEYANILDELMVAVEGVAKVGDELNSQYRDELAGYLVHKVMGRLIPPKPADAVVPGEQPAQPEQPAS